jgi:hypothetical protein
MSNAGVDTSKGLIVDQRFELVRGGVVLGVVALDGSDFPWFIGELKPSPEYGTVEPLFAEMHRILEDEGFTERSGELHELITGPGIQLRSLPDGAITEVTGISIVGRRVSWRA